MLCPFRENCEDYSAGRKQRSHHIRITVECVRLNTDCPMLNASCNIERIKRIKASCDIDNQLAVESLVEAEFGNMITGMFNE